MMLPFTYWLYPKTAIIAQVSYPGSWNCALPFTKLEIVKSNHDNVIKTASDKTKMKLPIFILFLIVYVMYMSKLGGDVTCL